MFLPFESITLLIRLCMCRHFQNSLCCINTCPDPRLKVNSHLSQVYHPIWATVRNHIIWSCQVEKMKTALKNQPFQTFLQFFVKKIAVRQVYRPQNKHTMYGNCRQAYRVKHNRVSLRVSSLFSKKRNQKLVVHHLNYKTTATTKKQTNYLLSFIIIHERELRKVSH